jgi:hypothetical protein
MPQKGLYTLLILLSIAGIITTISLLFTDINILVPASIAGGGFMLALVPLLIEDDK